MTLGPAIVLWVVLVTLAIVLFQWMRLRAVLRKERVEKEALWVKPRAVPRQRPQRQLQESPAELHQALQRSECVLFLGTEYSVIREQPPQWQVLHSLLAESAGGFAEDVTETLDARLRAGDLEVVAQMLVPGISPMSVRRALREMGGIDARSRPGSSDLSRVLGKLPFAGVLTDAWQGVEPLFRGRGGPVLVPSEDADFSPQSLLRSTAFFIVHLKGLLEKPNSLRLSWQQFKEDLQANRGLLRFLVTLNSSRSLLFVGAGVETIERYFEATLPVHGKRNHFALVPWQPEDFPFEARSMSERFNVRLIPVAGDWGQLHFLEGLQAQTNLAALRRGRPRMVKPPLARILRLENIGPFESLELPLDPSVTVLLGDNGSGKSSVLRAIAVLLAGEGERVDRAAEGLLRTETGRGSIELEFDGEVMRTVLERDRSRNKMTVHTAQISPVAEGLWLGLGFPPLRGAPVDPLKGPASEVDTDPSAEDVLPLAGNWIDQRFGDLQQWILNTAVIAEGSSQEARRAEHILESFFSIVADLTPGVEFNFVGYEPRSWRVLLKTEDGVVSVDQLSRGMTAMLGWVGVLLRRLFQIYGTASERPQEERAFVLLDEIDLHLHPGWQRQVLPLLKRHFPGLQLVASTHSPLVVGSMTEGCLIHLQRQGGAILPEVMQQGFVGWRSDQILTSPAFDLMTTRDPLTEERLAEYRRLLAGGLSNPQERRRAAALAEMLHEEIPGTEETEVGREGARLVREAVQHRLAEVPAERREEVYREAEHYLRQLQGSQRAEK